MKINIKDKTRINIKKFGFTLAEVLIVLGIIGIVAEMTIPNLVTSYKSQIALASLKKFQSVFQEALTRYATDNGCLGDLSACGGFDNGNEYSGEASVNAWNALKKYFRVSKDCGSATNTGCIPVYKNLIGMNSNYGDQQPADAKAVLQDGTIIEFVDYPTNCTKDASKDHNPNSPFFNDCAFFNFDTNGFKGPNRIGRDVFSFDVTKNGSVYPAGALDYLQSPDDYCTMTGPYKNHVDNGLICTAKVMEEGGIKY